ncbi:MAG: ribonuclease III [Parvibaculum sp.]|nr:ribonuclease III [Parvibaculum sp.]MDO8840146.1 ribonuclease III [Parvibaculum sp.]
MGPARQVDRLSAALQAKLSYEFKDKGLLARALTHPSSGPDNYQRLEFLGDRVLGLVVAEWLSRLFPDADEGELAIRYNALVRKEACAEVASRIDLGSHIAMGAGEVKAGGRQKAAILADGCEALIAALYLDGGLAAATRFIEAQWAQLIDKNAEIPQDAKTALQEWAHAQGLSAPSYRQTARSGPDHAPEFTVEVLLEGHKPLIGKGNSKRQAEQAAARALLEAAGVWR